MIPRPNLALRALQLDQPGFGGALGCAVVGLIAVFLGFAIAVQF